MENNKQWFKEAKFGMMIHWGLYSVLAGEYKGKRVAPVTGEWIMSWLNIPIKEYEKLCNAFNPIYFNADEWAELAVEAGMKYVVFTAKHHDGFALYHSKTDKYNIVDATPFKRDIVRELSVACRKRGLKFGLYYSQELDWHEEHGGGYSIEKDQWEGKSWSNNWDFKDKSKKDYSICFNKKIKPQVKEILTEYGEVDLIWFDCPVEINEKQSLELYNLVKKYQPNCLINSRIGTAKGIKSDYKSWGDNEIPQEYQDGAMMFETPATLNDTWGYVAYDQNWKSVEEVIRLKNHLNSRGINYLLNVGPDYLGRIPVATVNILRNVGRESRINIKPLAKNSLKL